MPRRALNVAPTDGSTKFNTIRIPLIPVACWRLDDPAFAFDSSFVGPNFRGEIVDAPADPTATPAVDEQPDAPLETLSDVVKRNEGCPVALFGHCDPAGGDDLNKTLGDRRATAIYALLTRQPKLWEELYAHPKVGDKWGTPALQTMLTALQRSTPVSQVQQDPTARLALFTAYMDYLCTPAPDASATSTDGATTSDATTGDPSVPANRLIMQPGDFLGGAAAQDGDLPQMSLQSCGKLNPIVLLTTAEMGGEDTTDGASKTTRNADDAPNRRVIMYFFPKGTKVDTGVWPCPKVGESNAKCSKAFWPNGDARRKNGTERRDYKNTRDTMACRFYDRFARRSPCEGGAYKLFPFGLLIELVDNDPWIGAATLQLLRADGSVAQEIRVSDGKVSGSYRVFYFRIREGSQYSCVLVGDGGTLALFDPTTLYGVFTEPDNDGLQHESAPFWQYDDQDDDTT
jgi:hypothetical protein